MLKEESFGIIPIKKVGQSYQVFLVQISSGNHWGFPKGHREENEDPKEVAKRELFEETNLQIIKYISDTSFQEKYIIKRENNKVIKTVIYFPAFVEGTIKLQEKEILDGDWFNIDEAIEKITFSNGKNICAKLPMFINKEII